MKKKFVINVHHDAVVTVAVVAEDLDEAKRIAEMEASSLDWEDYGRAVEFSGTDSCESEVSDLTDEDQDLIEAGHEVYFNTPKKQAGTNGIPGHCIYTCFDRVMALVKPVEGEENLKDLVAIIHDDGIHSLLDFGVEKGCFTKEQSSTLFDGIVMWSDLPDGDDANYYEEDYDKFMALQEAMGCTEEVYDKYCAELNLC